MVQMFLAYVICGWKGCPYNSFISNRICEDFVKYELPECFLFLKERKFWKSVMNLWTFIDFLLEYCSG